MRRIQIIAKGLDLDPGLNEYWTERGVTLVPVLSSWLSAFTSMSVAREAKQSKIDEVVVTRIKDAMAAISARRISPRPFVIVFDVQPNSAVPRSVPAEVRREVDRWLFPSERLRGLYPDNLNDAQIKAPICYDRRLTQTPLPYPTDAPHILWIGDIDGNVDRLISVINEVGNSETAAELRILGTGRARYAMQAVRASRAVAHPDRIAWLGADADLYEHAAWATDVVQSGPDATAEEQALQATGRKLIPYPV